MSDVARGLAKLRGVRGVMLPDPARVQDAASFNRVLDECVSTLNRLRLDEGTPEPEPVTVVEEKKKKKKNVVKFDLGRDRMEHGGTERTDSED